MNKKAEYTIEWKIVKQMKLYAPNKKVYYLCLEENFRILMEKPMLNRRKEIFSFCVHKKHFLLKNDESTRARNTSVIARP